jgi:hypothetical protein
MQPANEADQCNLLHPVKCNLQTMQTEHKTVTYTLYIDASSPSPFFFSYSRLPAACYARWLPIFLPHFGQFKAAVGFKLRFKRVQDT